MESTITVRAFGLATYLYGKNIIPQGTTRDGGDVVFLYGAEAAPEIAQYRADKARLVQLMERTK